MRNIFKSLFIVLSCLTAGTAFAQVQSFSATEITASSGTTKGAVTVKTTFALKSNAQICKEGSTSTKDNVVEGKNTASSVDEHYVEISSTSDISALRLHATYNSSGAAKNMGFVYWGANATPAYDNVLGCSLIGFVGYDGACNGNYVDVNIPTGVRKIRIYRQLKGFDGTGYSKNAKYGDGQTFFIVDIDVTAGPAPKSTDATLSDLKVDGVTIAGFNPNTTSYNYSVAATATSAPVLSATKNDSKASNPVITQPAMPTAGSPTVGTVQVTAEDGTTTKTYTVNFTRAELSHDATLSDIKVDGQSISGFTPGTTSYTVNIPYSQTTIPVVTATTTHAGANAVVTAASAIEGTATILVTAEDGSTTNTYTLTFHKVAASTDATLSSLSYNGQPISGFNPSTTSYSVELPEGSYPPSVSAEANHPFATVAIQQATSTSGMATITVTAEDGSTTKTYTIQFSETAGPPVPPTSLLIHKPEKYEGKTTDGGYGTKLTVIDGHEYEVYYTERTSDSDYPTFSTMPVAEGKTTGISGSTSTSKNVGRAGDTWFEGTINSHSECKNASSQDEFVFGAKMIREHRLSSSNTYQFHVQGYDQFSLWGMDKKLDPKNGNQVFVVKVDGVEQPIDGSLYNTSSYTIRRFNISTREHLIEISTTRETGTNTCNMGGFSLRVPQAPKLKYLKGDDSAQVVLQTMPINKVVYTCKYNHIEGAETRLEWDGQEATGISLGNIKTGELIDTLSIVGNANCPVGTYRYAVVTYLHGAETSRLTGQFKVKSDIRAMNSVNAEAYLNEEMDQIIFKYYALSESDVQLNWTLKKPQGSVDGYSTQPGDYVIGGTPKEIGTFPFTISVTGADTIIKGTLTVKEITYGDNAVLYLYKNDLAYNKDGVYNYLKEGVKYNPISRRAKLDGLRPSDQYANYKWVLISEDVDADNPEILALARGEGNLPVLSMKAFSYTKERLNWGDPNNGALTKEGRFIKVVRDDHPIFKALNKKQGDSIQVLDSTGGKGLMPISVNYTGTLCLATSLTRDINDYNGNGPEETFLHEVPAEMHRNIKYLCLPIGQSGSNYLHADGKRLIDECIKYILSKEPTIQLPDLGITQFQIGSYTFVPEKDEDKIIVEVLEKDSDMLKTATPFVALASPMTHVYPSVTNEDGTVDLTNWRFGVQYIVSDYINKRSYEVVARIKAAQGIDEIEAGEWINIYDIYGRKVATTNEDFRTMDLPRGMYILVTESGKTLKVMR